MLHPVNMKTAMTKAKEAGLTPEGIADNSGLKFKMLHTPPMPLDMGGVNL